MDQLALDRAQAAAKRSQARPLHNLPAALTPFVGRKTERAQVIERLRDPACRLLTIVGAGGIGKTRLAIEGARELLPGSRAGTLFPHGVYLVSLASLDPFDARDDLLATTVASAIGLALSGPETAQVQVGQYVREKALLLIFDNFEQVLAGAGFVTALLQEAPDLKILATSRERLNVRGERVVELDGLRCPDDEQLRPDAKGLAMADQRAIQPTRAERQASPSDLTNYDAIRLFVQIAQAVAPDFALTGETAPAVTRICRIVHGLPLGIELAAAWVRVLSCDEIGQEIAQNIDFLTGASQDLPARQQSMRAVFEYSWNLLSDIERRALRQLAVFRSSFTREAAAAVLSLELSGKSGEIPAPQLKAQNSELLTLLASLVDKSLLRRAGSGSAARYEVLELLRQFAAEQLDGAGEAAAAAGRHARYYAGWMAARTADLRGPEQPAALAQIDGEIEHVRAAWRWSVAERDDAALGQMADSLFHFYDIRSWFQEGSEAFGGAVRALAAAPGLDRRLVYGKVLARYAWFTFHLGRQAEARDLLEQSLALLRELDARAEMIFALNYLGSIHSYLGGFDRTRALCQESLAITEALGDLYGRAIAFNILGQAAYELGAYAEAKGWHQQSLTIEQQTGNRWSMAFSLTNLGRVAYALREYDEARRLFEQSLQTRQETGDVRGVAICFNRLGDIAIAQADVEAAGRRYAQSLALFREIGNQWGMASSLINLGRLAAAQKHDAAAGRLLQEALRLALATQAAPQVAQILAAFELVARRNGEAGWAAELAAISSSKPVALDRLRPHAERLLAWSSAGSPAMTLDQALEAALRPAPAPPAPLAPPAPASFPAGLTAREVAVLRLVAQGLTDAQVADRLIVSPRTVSTHLTSIYGKLGVSSRAAATRFAVEHGLV